MSGSAMGEGMSTGGRLREGACDRHGRWGSPTGRCRRPYYFYAIDSRSAVPKIFPSTSDDGEVLLVSAMRTGQVVYSEFTIFLQEI